MKNNEKHLRKPSWLKIKLPGGDNYKRVKETIEKHHLHTICGSGKCPNMGECWGLGTATFMILGETCTRSCKFCATLTGKPLPPDEGEPEKIAGSIKLLTLKHAVITSVDRDDLADGGARIWAETIRAVKKQNPNTTLEVLIPDFNGQADLIGQVIDASPDVISHNLETVERLTPEIRSKARYRLSLKVIGQVARSSITSKSGIMVGLGETMEEIHQTMDDLLQVGCKVMTIGQYLQPTKDHLSVKKYYHPDEFKEMGEIALKKGFKQVESAPLVRSSYHAEKHVQA
jgi:lipoic acid synthetase